MIASAPREQAGDPGEMWDRIVREVSSSDLTFMSLVGRNSAGTEFEAGKLIVIVSPNKLRLAEDKSVEIARAAKMLYGDEVFVSMRSGSIAKSGATETEAVISEAETSRIINEDIDKNEVIEDIQNLFGITPVIED